MAHPSDITLDLYAPLSHKAGLTSATAFLAPTWVGETHRRRLAAYRILHAYLGNVARYFFTLDSDATLDDVAEQASKLEYGDPALLVDRICAGILGDSVTIAVDGADLDASPSLPPKPDPAPADATPIEQRVAEVAMARWEADAEAVVDEWEAAAAAQPALAERERWLRDWAETVGLIAKIRLALLDAVGLGDGVLAVGWDGTAPTLERYDPGFYFPVLDDDTPGRDEARKRHIAWEYETSDGTTTKRWIRRLTWELVPFADDATFTYPWNEENPSSVVCVFSDGTWPATDHGGRHIDDLADDKAVAWRAQQESLGVDFIPVRHIQGVDVGDDYGRSALALVAHLLDEIISTDSDVSAAQALAAGPAIALAGGSADDVTVQPGVVYSLAADGSMDVLDLSKGLSEIRATLASLLERLSVNSQVPAEVLGRVESGSDLAGITVRLRFGPYEQLIGALRLGTMPDLAAVLTMVQRVAQANGALEPGPTPVARVVPGSFLPADLAGLVELVARLLAAKAISHETAVHLLVSGGMSIPDAAGEVARIRAGDPQGAKFVFDAAGQDAASGWLGVPPPAPDPATDLGT